MLREKEELMLRLQDYEQKTKKAEKGEATAPGRRLFWAWAFYVQAGGQHTHPWEDVHLHLMQTCRETGWNGHWIRKYFCAGLSSVLGLCSVLYVQ